ncbi:MAG: NAD(P)/FAD-dependent oxidoreductase [Candidatus Binataceae bacterium]
MAAERYDVVVIGAGIIGSALAMALAERNIRAVAVDVDLIGRLSSSEKNAGGVRATWWQPVNIRLCLASIAYYQTLAAEVGFRQKGYLWLYDDKTWDAALERVELQRKLGHQIETLAPAQVSERVPEIDRLDGIAGATFSPRDGLINSNLLKEHYRTRARSLGAEFRDRIFVDAIDAGTSGVRIECWRADERLSDEALVRMLGEDERGEAQTGHVFELSADAIVIAGGAWSKQVLKLLNLESPSEPIRRQISVVDNRETNFERYGMIVDTSGVYFHNEGPHILAGYSPPEEPPGYHFHYDGEEFFRNEIWPRMYARMSCCERMRHVTGWAGLYSVTPDRSAIVGMARERVYEAHSFSGRGVMQSYGAAEALAELIARGSYGELDASTLSRDRFASGAEILEPLHI